MQKSFLIIFILAAFAINAQSVLEFKDLESQGVLPADIVSPTYHTYEEALKDNLIDDDKGLTKKSKDNFILNSSYYINDLFTSGDIVFNDTVTNYLNKVKDVVLNDFPEIKQKVRVYTYKSPIVNALATNEGVIFVTTGLLARLSSEAQLAYILSHEISHYVDKHPINSYVEEITLEKKDKSFKKLSGTNKFKLLSKKSRETELEADEHGYIYFHSTTYDSNAPVETFHILESSNKAYEVRGNLTLNEFYNIGNKIPQNIFVGIEIDKGNEHETNEEDVLFSSHPAIADRIMLAEKKNMDFKGHDKFIVSESWFNQCKNISRVVNVKQLLNMGVHNQAFQFCYLLEKEFGNEKYITKLKLRTFYEVAKIKDGQGDKVLNLNFMGVNMSEVTDVDAYLVALNVVNDYEKNYGVDKYTAAVKKDIIEELKGFNNEEGLAGVSLINEYKALNSQLEEPQKVVEQSTYDFYYLNLTEKYAKSKRRDFYKHYWNTGTPVKNVIVIDPSWNAFDTRKGMHSISSEKQTIELDEALLVNAKKSGLNIKLLSTNSLTENDVEAFNDRIVLINYLRSKTDDQMNIVFSEIEQFDEIMKENNANHIALMSINSILIKDGVMDYVANVLAMATFVGIPYGAYMLMKKSYVSNLYFVVYDTNKNNIDFMDIRSLKVNTNSMIINSYYYEYFKILGKSKKMNR